MCAYSHDAALCNYSFLVRLYVASKSPICTWYKYTLSTPSRYDRAYITSACMRYQRSGYGQRSWFTTAGMRESSPAVGAVGTARSTEPASGARSEGVAGSPVDGCSLGASCSGVG